MANKTNYWPWIIALLIGGWIFMSYRGSKTPDVAPPDDRWFQTEVVDQPIPVLVKFGAEWCGPCRAMEPTLAELSKTMDGRVKIVDIDVDKYPQLAKHYQVSSIPRLFLLDHGKIVSDRVGADSQDGLERWIAASLSKQEPVH